MSAPEYSDRQQQAVQWVNHILDARPEVRYMPGDASFRRYARVNRDVAPPLVLMDAPPPHENSGLFEKVASVFLQAGARVPQIIAHDVSHGFMLLEDFGNSLLSERLNPDTVDRLYPQAIRQMVAFQQHTPAGLPRYSREKLLEEMKLFDRWFLPELLDYPITDNEQQLLVQTFDQLATNALEQPEVLVHRDYHCRNLMVLEDSPELGIIDFQDAVTGPLTYDLVSLLRDAYVEWPETTVKDMLDYYREEAVRQGVLDGQVTPAQLHCWFDLTGAQRHIKILGIFARLALRDGKTGYLDNIPLVFRYLVRELAVYPRFEPFTHWLKSSVAPVYTAKTGHVLNFD